MRYFDLKNCGFLKSLQLFLRCCFLTRYDHHPVETAWNGTRVERSKSMIGDSAPRITLEKPEET